MTLDIQPFSIAIGDDQLEDVRTRLKMARFADDLANDDWAYGTNGDYLRSIRDYWLNDYDWRAQEREMNRFSHFKTEIQGNPIHFIHERGKGPNPVPIILNHGWPWTFWDMRKIIGPLTDPAAHGGDPKDSFDVIVPSLPGYGFSMPLKTTGMNFWRTADLWADLMTALGYSRFASHGSDWGAIVTAQLGHKYADRLFGIHATLTMPLDIFQVPLPGAEYYSEDEAGWYERTSSFFTGRSAYAALQASQPQTLAYLLNESPVAQAAWLIEKRRAWSDCKGDVETVFSKDDLITTAMIYWLTQSGGTSGRYYYECAHNPWKPSHDRSPVVEAPAHISIFEQDITLLPRKWAEGYFNVKHWKTFPNGGHFAAAEQPKAVIDEIRAAFRPSR